MLYAGVLAAGAIAGAQVSLLRNRPTRRHRELRRPRPRREPRLPVRGIGRLGDRPLGRPAAARAPRPLVSHQRRDSRARRALVRAFRSARSLPRADHPRGPFLHLDPRWRLPHADARLRSPDASRLGDLVLRVRRCRLGARRQLGELSSLLPLRRLRGGRPRRARRRLPACSASARPLQAAWPRGLSSSKSRPTDPRLPVALRAAAPEAFRFLSCRRWDRRRDESAPASLDDVTQERSLTPDTGDWVRRERRRREAALRRQRFRRRRLFGVASLIVWIGLIGRSDSPNSTGGSASQDAGAPTQLRHRPPTGRFVVPGPARSAQRLRRRRAREALPHRPGLSRPGSTYRTARAKRSA